MFMYVRDQSVCEVSLHLVFQGQEVKSLGFEVSAPTGQMSITFPDSSDMSVFSTFLRGISSRCGAQSLGASKTNTAQKKSVIL